MSWSAAILKALQESGVTLISHVPDKILGPLIAAAEASPHFRVVAAAREDEAVGIVAGAWLGGTLGIAMMQTSGFGNIPNVLASLVLPYQIPVLTMISERGRLGEFNACQVPMALATRPMLDALGILHHTLDDVDDAYFIVKRAVEQAALTQTTVAFVLSPLLTDRETVRP